MLDSNQVLILPVTADMNMFVKFEKITNFEFFDI